MDVEPIKVRLNRTLSAARLRNIVGIVASLLGGLLVLYLSFWASYVVIWIISHSFLRLSQNTNLLIAGAFMPLVVIVGAKQNLKELDPLERQVKLARDMDIMTTTYKLDGLFMDFYGTLVGGEPPIEDICRRAIDQYHLPLSPQQVCAAWNKGFFAALDTSNNHHFRTMHRINCDALRDCVNALAGRDIDPEPPAAALDEWLCCAPVFEETREVLAELRRRGIRVWIVSNADQVHALKTLEAQRLRVDGIVTSESARSYKPDAAIFRQALEATGWSPQRVMHVGDSLVHDVGGAQALGMRAVWVCRNTPPAQAAAIRPDHRIADLRGLLPLLA